VGKDEGLERLPLHVGQKPRQVRPRDTPRNRRVGGVAQPLKAIAQEAVNGRDSRAAYHDGEDHPTEDEGELMAFASIISGIGELLQGFEKR
jgi:hypothetical protein